MAMSDSKIKTYGTPVLFAGDTKAYKLQVRENGKLVTDQELHDPFITTRIMISPINFLRILFGRYKLEVNVNGNREAMDIVMGSNYAPRPPKQSVSMEGLNADSSEEG